MADTVKKGGSNGGVGKGSKGKALELADCEGLPREMLDTGCVPEHVFFTMDFLWKAANNLRLTSPAVSRLYSDQLRKLCAEHEAQQPGSGPLLPDWVSQSLCNSCGGVLTPGVNCRIRVRHRGLASPCVKNAGRKAQGREKKRAKKCLNEVVTTCFICGGINPRGGTQRWSHDKKRRRRVGEVRGGDRGGDRERAGEDSDEYRGRQMNGKKRARTTTTLRGNFIPLGDGRGGGDNSGAAVTATPTQKNANRRLKPSMSPSPGMKNAGDRSTKKSMDNKKEFSGPGSVAKSRSSGNAKAGSGGGGGGGGRQGGDSESTEESSTNVAYKGRGEQVGRTEQRGVMHRGGSVGGGDGQGQGEKEAKTPPALSLLERIRRDGKKKRRQDAAAAAAAAAAASIDAAAAPTQDGHS